MLDVSTKDATFRTRRHSPASLPGENGEVS